MKLVRVLSAIAVLAAATAARAHVCNVDLTIAAPTSCGDPAEGIVTYTPVALADGSVAVTVDTFTPSGWWAGTRPVLGDSHVVAGEAFFTFSLARWSVVSVRFAGPAPLDPAFSLYLGKLPDEAHDDAGYDPLNPLDPNTFLPVASPTDANRSPRYRYRAHDGFRDTLRYSTTGGLGADGFPVNPFEGQFDALGDWSMANDAADPTDPTTIPGNWAKVFYIISRNARGVGLAETQAVLLPPGDYTIAAGGAQRGTATVPPDFTTLLSGTVSVKIAPLR